MIDQTGCIGNTIRRASGGYFDLANPRPEDVNIEDIATGLSNICRYNGQLPDGKWYSVAEHCVLCYDYCSSAVQHYSKPWLLKDVLLHDAAEAYCGDVSKPLKNLLLESSDVYERIENSITNAIKLALNLPFPGFKEQVKYCDRVLLFTEKKQIFGRSDNWTDEEQFICPDWLKLKFLSPIEARYEFMKRWQYANNWLRDERLPYSE
jgi:uncharacterized protein